MEHAECTLGSTESQKPPADAQILPSASVLAFSADKNRIVFQKGSAEEKYPGGLGLPIFLYYLLNLIKNGELTWDDEVTVNEYALQEARHPNSLGLARLEKINLLALFQAAVISNSPDAVIALSWHIREKIGDLKNTTVSVLRKIGYGWGIPNSAIKNVTGRYYENNPQYFTKEILTIRFNATATTDTLSHLKKSRRLFPGTLSTTR